MYLLAFETSCDDTSVAVFRDETLLCMRTESQIAKHAETRGVVPEVAARLHENVVFEVVDAALAEAGIALADIDLVAATAEPGLMPSLLVGLTVARTLAHELGVPFRRIHHIHAHILANHLERPLDSVKYPVVCLTVSGGHNELYLLKGPFEKILLGQSLDDAAGEAFDKVAKMLGLGYPGGPVISRLSAEYAGIFRGIFPRPLLSPDSLDFSFSGLKSAVRREIDERSARAELSLDDLREIAHEFEMRTVEILAHKLFLARDREGAATVLLAGGVSANDRLRALVAARAQELGIAYHAPAKKIYSMDNAAMIGITAYLAEITLPSDRLEGVIGRDAEGDF